MRLAGIGMMFNNQYSTNQYTANASDWMRLDNNSYRRMVSFFSAF